MRAQASWRQAANNKQRERPLRVNFDVPNVCRVRPVFLKKPEAQSVLTHFCNAPILDIPVSL
jgi:hypothetical protein